MVTDVSALITSLSNFGGLGVVIAFLIWKDIRADKVRERSEERHRSELQLREERRLAFDRERLETDKETAGTLAALSSAIQNMGRR